MNLYVFPVARRLLLRPVMAIVPETQYLKKPGAHPMKKTLISLIAVAFAFVLGTAQAAKHEAPGQAPEAKKEMKKDDKAKKAAKKKVTKEAKKKGDDKKKEGKGDAKK